jgi:Deoxyribonuclease II
MNTPIQNSVALKAPNGRKYISMDLATGDTTWKYDPNETIDRFICQQINTTYAWKGWLFYNDEPPVGHTASGGGHCKGIVVYDDTYVGWLIHSVPKWPKVIEDPSSSSLVLSEIDHDECIYGQSFLWLVLPKACMGDILTQLKLMQAHVYHAPKDVFVPRKRAPAAAYMTRQVTLNQNLLHIGKHSKWGKDIFEDLVVPTIGGGKCTTETWSRPGQAPSANVDRIKSICWSCDHMVKYNDEQDHSKWAISCDPENPWVFIGDINAMSSQFYRGGGGMLIKHPELWRAMHSLIIS